MGIPPILMTSCTCELASLISNIGENRTEPERNTSDGESILIFDEFAPRCKDAIHVPAKNYEFKRVFCVENGQVLFADLSAGPREGWLKCVEGHLGWESCSLSA